MEVYDATAASRYDVTDVVLREEVPPLNMASEPTYPDELKRAILTTMFDDSCDDSNSNSNAKM
ncbi:hypothetical protein HBI34_167260 [Parastagonospora nodorum]|nr:hypothetical protein HBI34_167260 [Parastagonospora nodorum]